MRRSIHIEAPVETVFAFFMDPKNFNVGQFKVLEMKATKEGTGSWYSWRAKMAGIPVEGFEVVTDLVPNRHITERSSHAFFGTSDYTFEPEGTGTQVTMTNRPASFGRLPPFAQLLTLGQSAMVDRFMPRFKAKIEGLSSRPVKAAG